MNPLLQMKPLLSFDKKNHHVANSLSYVLIIIMLQFAYLHADHHDIARSLSNVLIIIVL